MDLFAKIVHNLQPLAIFEKSSILDAWQDSDYASALQSARI